MAKLALFPALLVAGCLIAGVYGALHDQISYTVSPDYYHAFKFHQFKVPAAMHNRLGAALVGWSASWWMGLVVGVPLLTVGLILPDWRVYLTRGLAAFAIITATALLFGIGGLVYATWTVSEHHLPAYWYPDAEIDRVAFARAGTMHNFSYLGGFLGLLVGVTFLAVERYRIARRPE